MAESLAAQYIRMSTDKQDLSPSVQKETIAAYAAAQHMQIVESYEDEGRSGIHLKNRPGLLRLLADVTGGTQFTTVLVYDVSRWGRRITPLQRFRRPTIAPLSRRRLTVGIRSTWARSHSP